MKVRRPTRAEAGSTLMIALVLAVIIMIALQGLLSYLTSEYRMVHRTYYFGNAIYLAEAGIEESVAMINYGSNNWAANGWSSINSTNYTKTIENFTPNTGGAVIGRYVMNIMGPTNNNPVIVCTGVVDATYVSMTGAVDTNIARAVRATLGKRAIFQWGLLSQDQINLNGNDINIDSFDSTDPTASNYDYTKGYGEYDSSKRKDNGDLASNGGITNTISVGNANIYGHANTGTGGGIGVGPNGFIAALGQSQSGVIDSNRVSHSMNVDLPPASLPTDFNSLSNLGDMSGTWNVSGGSSSPVDYTVSSIDLTGGNTMTISSGYVRLYVTGNINVSGSAGIIIQSGAQVEFYVLGSTSIAGNGVANNNNQATDFQLYGLGSEAVSVSGNGQLAGVVYAPQSAVTISGGGSSGEVMGAMVGRTITLGGHVTFHYDEALKNSGPTRGYSIVSWQEL